MEPKAKRIRGWKLEMAKEAGGSEPLLKGEQEVPSALGTLLLTMWSHGHISAKAMQELAHMAILDGATHPELAQIVSTGHWGEIPGNVHRDIMTHYCQDIKLTPAIHVQVPVLEPKTSKVLVEDASIFLPHILFSDLAHHYPDQFHNLFGTQDLQSFWKGVEKVKDDRLYQHPICLDERHGTYTNCVQEKQKTIPLFIHCDGVEFQSRDSLQVWNWGGLLCQYHSLAAHFLVSAIPKACTTESTWDPIMEWVTWSLEALLKGYHPEVGPKNEPLLKGSPFHALKGLPLTPGNYRAVVWAVQGDHEMYSNTVHLPHWNATSPCWDCDCKQPFSKGTPCEKGKSFKIVKEGKQRFIYVDTKAALLKGKTNHPLFSVPGLTTRMVRHDGLHVLFVRGVCAHLVGSILHYMAFFDGKGVQSVKPSERLAFIFEEIQEVYKRSSAPTRLTNLKLSMICDVAKPHKQFAKLDCKGAGMKHLCVALLPVIKNMLDRKQEQHRDMVSALQCMVDLIQLFDRIGIFPSSKEYMQARNLEKRFFAHYDSLNIWAQENDRLLFHLVMKHHTLHHMVRDSQFLNPRNCWNFRAEDFVGKISRLGASVAMGVKSTKMSQKINAKYRILLHLQLVRLGFGLVSCQDDP